MIASLVDKISQLKNIQRKDLIEKDILLHQILTDLSKERLFLDNVLFKGGTCLIKCYLGYIRFSEDIDLVWRAQNRFADNDGKLDKGRLDQAVDQIGAILDKAAKGRKMDFKFEKDDPDYVQFTNRKQFCTFKIWYNSVVTKQRTFLQVQINFTEKLCLNPVEGKLNSLLKERDPVLEQLFDQYSEYASAVSFKVYDIKEILSEKIRALLTRRSAKNRDLLDIFLISKNMGINPQDVEKCAIEKLKHALKNYERFRISFDANRKLLERENMFRWKNGKKVTITEPLTEKTNLNISSRFLPVDYDVLLIKIDNGELKKFLAGFTCYLRQFVKKIDA